jgi:oligopeptide transport system permease protein
MTDPTAATTWATPHSGAAEQAAGHARGVDPGGQRKPRGLGSDAWAELRRKPLFFVSMVIIFIVLLIALFPQLFTSLDPTKTNLNKVRELPGGDAWFGYDTQGRDVYARVIYGTRASVLVGVLSMVLTVAFGSVVGLLGGYYGGWLDNIVSRVGEIFVGLPFVLGAIVILTTFNAGIPDPSAVRVITQVVLSISILSWPISMRIMRAATLAAKQQDFVQAARGLGASTFRIMTRHLLPNTVAPVLVYATIALGAFIGAEATLAFLGVGLRPPVVSWGVMIADSAGYVRTAPHMLLFPAGFVTITVLAFVMIGDVVRDALDPKSR